MMESILDGAAKTQDQRIAMVCFQFNPSQFMIFIAYTTYFQTENKSLKKTHLHLRIVQSLH